MMHIRLDQQGKTLREIDKPQLFMAAKAAGLPLMSIGEPPGVAAYDFHFGRDLDAGEQAQFEALFRGYDPATADTWQADQAAAAAARKADLQPLKQAAAALLEITDDLAAFEAATAAQRWLMVKRALDRELKLTRALARLVEWTLREDEG